MSQKIDPALRGTTYAAALEAAARDEQLKRDDRAREMADVMARARALAEQMRLRAGHTRPASKSVPVVAQPVTEDDYAAMLSSTQVSILKAGTEAVHFRLTRAQANMNSSRLADWELIMPVRRGVYTLTEAGKRVYSAWLAAHPEASLSPAPVSSAEV